MASTYVDSSAIVKLALREDESAVLKRYLRRRYLVSSALARTEVIRAVLSLGEEGIRAGQRALSGVHLVRVSDNVLNAAGTLMPPELRSLDAIHLATARDLGDEVGTFVTYDTRMAHAAREMGYTVRSPS